MEGAATWKVRSRNTVYLNAVQTNILRPCTFGLSMKNVQWANRAPLLF